MPLHSAEPIGYALLACGVVGLAVSLAGSGLLWPKTDALPPASAAWSVRGGVPKNWKGPDPQWDSIGISATADPASLPMDGESILTVAVTALSPDYASRGVRISFVSSNALAVAPGEAVLAPHPGATGRFVITPTAPGSHNLLVNAQCVVDADKAAQFPQPSGLATLQLEIRPAHSFLGMTNSSLDVLQKASSLIGLPGLILVFLGRKRRRRSKRAA
ncbi:MAG TPA: hypothetical protein VGF85_06860 [Opitutaceae bacterium]|jgi:hypothetical protein